MSGKACLMAATVAMVLLGVISGCSPSARVSLQFTPNTTASYEVTTEVTKDFRFEQPTVDKLREEQTQTLIRMGFTQTVTDVDSQGVATCDVRIDSLAITMTNKNEERLVFDSTNEAHRTNPLMKLIGQHYTVQMSPDGKVVGFDSEAAKKAVTTGVEGQVAKRLLEEVGIRERHEIPAIWDIVGLTVASKKTWKQVVPSPPGALEPKSYEKVYTLKGIETKNGHSVAVIEMKAMESAEPAPGQTQSAASGMGFFAKMFDSQDDYTGKLLLDLSSGEVLEYNETLVSTYLAKDTPANAPPAAEPDTLTMRFTHRIAMKKLN